MGFVWFWKENSCSPFSIGREISYFSEDIGKFNESNGKTNRTSFKYKIANATMTRRGTINCVTNARFQSVVVIGVALSFS